MYESNYRGSGCLGCIAELLNASETSKKLKVATTGKTDNFSLRWRENGKVTAKQFESKTNGGRIAAANGKVNKGKWIVYKLDICNAGTNHKLRSVPAKLIPMDVFVNTLLDLGAVKAVNKEGKLDGYGIQASSKSLYEWLLNWPVNFDRNRIYSAADFEGLC